MSFLTTFSFPYMLNSDLGGQGCFWIYSVVSFAGFIFIASAVPETSGKTEAEISMLFQKKADSGTEKESPPTPILKSDPKKLQEWSTTILRLDPKNYHIWQVTLKCFTRVIQTCCQVIFLNVPPSKFLEITSDFKNVNSCDLKSELPAFTPLLSGHAHHH